MSDFDIHAAATRIHHQYSARRRQALARRERAQAFGRSLAPLLAAADAGLIRVWGFGSTFETWRNYRLDSDLDLGIEGGNNSLLLDHIPPSEFEVSLIDLSDQPDSFVLGIKAHGVLLYERK